MSNISEPKTAIVTGGARGIGRAIALKLAHDGLDVTIADLPSMKAEAEETAAEITKLGRRANVGLCDVAIREQVETLVAEHVAALGPLYAMIANAGICQVKSVLDISEDDVRRIFEVNVYGVFNCYQAAAKQIIVQKTHGRLIGCSSVAGQRASMLLSHYSASKFAVRGLTQGFALEMARHDIRVNSFCPGIHDTKMWEELDEALGIIENRPKGESIKKQCDEQIVLKRRGTPEDVAKVVSFLTSDASEYMTGQSVIVDGGIYFS